METEVKNSELVTASIAWSESEGEEMVEETDGLRNAGFGDDEVQSPLRFLKSAHPTVIPTSRASHK